MTRDLKDKKQGVVTRLIGCALLVCLTNTANAKPTPKILDVKGLALGSLTTPDAVASALGIVCDESVPDETVCKGTGHIADEFAEIVAVVGKDNIFDGVSFTIDSSSFDHVALSLTSKFGRASKISHPIVQNGLGAVFQDDERVWYGKNGTQLSIGKYNGALDKSDVSYSTSRKRKRQAAGDGPSSDL